MHVIPKYQTSVSLFHVSGKVTVYKTKAHARRALGLRWIADNVRKEFRAFSHREYFADSQDISFVYGESEYVMRDDFGQPLLREDFLTPRDRLYSRRLLRGYYCGYGPVPRTGKSRSYSRYYRGMRTQQARRMAQVMSEEEIRPRPKRSEKSLRSSWDDVYRHDLDHRSWKRHRKTQWKA